MSFFRVSISVCMIALFASTVEAQNAAKATTSQQSVSQTALFADQYDQGSGVPINFGAAARLYIQAAKAGNAHAQYKLGTYFRKGYGVEPDLAQSFKLLLDAATSGHPDHLFALAQMYEQGVGTERDVGKAIDLYTQAAQAGSSDAHVNAGVIYQNGSLGTPNPERAFAHFKLAAEANNARGQNNLGLLYSRGEGIEQDYDQAFNLFQAAAKSGLSKAIKNLGVMYENGFGTPFDDEIAHELYRRAGRSVQDRLSKTIDDLGILTDPRILEASPSDITGLHQAAKSGDIVAQYILSQTYLSAPRPNSLMAETAYFTSRSAQSGFVNAKANLGVLYVLGYGVPQDYVLAYSWVTQARANGITKLDPLIKELSTLMTRVQVAKAQAIAAKQWESSLN